MSILSCVCIAAARQPVSDVSEAGECGTQSSGSDERTRCWSPSGENELVSPECASVSVRLRVRKARNGARSGPVIGLRMPQSFGESLLGCRALFVLFLCASGGGRGEGGVLTGVQRRLRLILRTQMCTFYEHSDYAHMERCVLSVF